MPSYLAASVAVEFAFGYAPGDVVPGGAWIDVTDYLDMTASSEALTASSGREAVRAGIDPGSMTFRLDNRDGRFSPRNSSGPYFGDLKNGVPVRVRTTYAAVTRTRWAGFVSGGWPQDLTNFSPVVNVEAHDLVGRLAQVEGPATAFDSFLATWANAPAHYYAPGPDGWMDRVTGRVATHTGALAAGDSPIIDGAGNPWGQVDPDGYGFSKASGDMINPQTEAVTVLARIQLSTEAERATFNPLALADPFVIVGQETATDFQRLSFTIYPWGIEVLTFGAGGARHGFTLEGDRAALLMDGKSHTVMAHVGTTGAPRIWVDGRELRLDTFTNATDYSATPTVLHLGGWGPRWVGFRPFTGYLDPVVIWRNHPAGTLGDLAAQSHAAATLAWAGDTLDARVDRLVRSVGLGAHLGTLDGSGIATRQGYRQAATLELLQKIEDTEQGRIWVDREGLLRFSRRAWAWADSRSTNVQATFSNKGSLLDAGTAFEMLDSGTVIRDDHRSLVNEASVTSEYGRQQTVTNEASVADYGRLAVSLDGLLHATDRESRSIAEWIISSQGTPQPRAEAVSFLVENSAAALAPLAQTIDQGDLVRIIVAQPSGPDLDIYAHVIGVRHSWTFTGWVVTLYLDGTRASRSFFTWGTSTWGGSATWAF
jgi:hypothetical protein